MPASTWRRCFAFCLQSHPQISGVPSRSRAIPVSLLRALCHRLIVVGLLSLPFCPALVLFGDVNVTLDYSARTRRQRRTYRIPYSVHRTPYSCSQYSVGVLRTSYSVFRCQRHQLQFHVRSPAVQVCPYIRRAISFAHPPFRREVSACP